MFYHLSQWDRYSILDQCNNQMCSLYDVEVRQRDEKIAETREFLELMGCNAGCFARGASDDERLGGFLI